MKNRTAMLFAFLLLACAVASAPTVAEEPFFVHGVSFGMTGEEVKAVMGEPFGVQAKDNLAVYTYVNVRFDKFSDGVFGCFLVDDRTALIAYQLPEGIMAENASWIESVLTQRYGKPVKDEALAGNVMELMMHYGLSPDYSVPRRAMWQSGDIYIVLFTDDAHLSVVCYRAVSENGKVAEGNRGRFSVMTEKQRMTYIVPGDEYGENSKSSGRQRDLPCDAAGITGKGYTKTTRNAYGEPSPVHTARRRMDSLVSMVFALSGADMSHYSETEIVEETLENGIRLRWQLMRGDAIHALWFEAFDDQFGYNMCIQCSADTADDEAMLAVMRSFRADPELEQGLLEVRQTQLPGGAFVSVEQGLQIQLNEDWEIVPYKEYLQPGTAFMLVLNEGEQMVQLFSTFPVDAGDARALLDWFLQAKGGSSAGEPYAVTLDGLDGVEALVAEETPGVCMYNVAFVHEGYGYYGMLMWVPQDDEEARPSMMEALRTLSVPEN